MLLPYDPILSLFIVVGVLAYYALKGSGKSRKEYNDPYSEDRFQTREMKERDRLWQMMKDKGIKNDYELWLFKQTDEYKLWQQENKN